MLTAEGRQNARLDDLQRQIEEFQQANAQLRAELANGGSARRPVEITSDQDFPSREGTTDLQQATKTAIDNLWAAIKLLRRDLKKLSRH